MIRNQNTSSIGLQVVGLSDDGSPGDENKVSKMPAMLEITAGQRTMSGQKKVLSGQIFGLPDILSGRLRM